MARALGYRIRETGIHWTRPRRLAAVACAKVLVPVMRELLAARRHVREEARPPAPPLHGRPPPSSPTPSLTAAAPQVRAAALQRSRGLAGYELAALAALFALLARGARRTAGAGLDPRRGGHRRDGYLVVDQLQYLNWLRQAGHHVAVGQPLRPRAGPALVRASGGAHLAGCCNRLGLGLVASYMVWKLAGGRARCSPARCSTCAASSTRTGDRPPGARARPLRVLAGRGARGLGRTRQPRHEAPTSTSSAGEIWTGTYLWGYMFTAIAVALLPLGLLAYERAPGRRAAASWAAACRAVRRLAPAVAGSDLRARDRRASRAAATRGGAASARARRCRLAATAAPLVYYFVLSRTDASWKLAGSANDFAALAAGGSPCVGLAPLAIPAPSAYRLRRARLRRRSRCASGRVAALLVFFYLPVGTFPVPRPAGAHARRWPCSRSSGCAACGAATPWLAAARGGAARRARHGLPRRQPPRRRERGLPAVLPRRPASTTRCATSTATKEPGGVLTPVYSGLLIPAYTGRETWIGAGSWTPDFERRRERDRAAVRRASSVRRRPTRLVQALGRALPLSDCHGRADIERARGAASPIRRGASAARPYTG